MLILSICILLAGLANIYFLDKLAKENANSRIQLQNRFAASFASLVSTLTVLLDEYQKASSLRLETLFVELRIIDQSLRDLIKFCDDEPCKFNESIKHLDPSQIHVVPLPPIPAGRDNHTILQRTSDGKWIHHSFRPAGHPDLLEYEKADGFAVIYPNGTIKGWEG